MTEFDKGGAAFSRLECGYLTEACGMAVEPPVFSWQGSKAVLQISDESGQVVYCSQTEVTSPFRPLWEVLPQKVYFWQLTGADGKSAAAKMETAFANDFEWLPAKWICDHYNPGGMLPPISVFIKKFQIPELPENSRARLYIGALGVYRAVLNGSAVSDQVLAPGAVDFSSRTLYQTYPVEKLLQSGENELSIELAGGWHNGAIARTGFHCDRPFYNTPDALIVRLELWKKNGSVPELLCFSDGSWQVYHDGPRRYSDIFMGEYFDGRRRIEKCSPLTSEIDIPVKLDARNGVPVRRIMELPALRMMEHGEVTVVDFGQNFTGRERITFTAPAGTCVKIRHGEMLDDNGMVYTGNLRTAEAMTTIIAPGGEFTFEPEFTFYGFRYIEVAGVKDFSVTAVVLHSDLEVCCCFKSSNTLLNNFMENVLWSQRSNFLDIPTDCPQRDERRGWAADAQIFAQAALYNMHGAAFFRKWLTDFRSCTPKNGKFPNYAPAYPYYALQDSCGVSGWADAGVVIPYLLYLNYGDREMLAENFPAICKWIDRQAEEASDGLVCHCRFGDWLNVSDPTGEEFISTAYFAYGAGLASEIAEVLDDEENGERMKRHRQMAQQAFRKKFIDGNGCLREKSQCAAAMALQFGLLNESERKNAVRQLTASVKERGNHLSTGFLGTPLLLPALSDNGETELAYTLLEQTGCPSWLYPVTQGATTIWERWDSWVDGRGFGNEGMNSFNHYAYGAAAAWVCSTAAGIRPRRETPGYREFILAPHPGGTLTELKLVFNSPAGRIVSAWSREDGEVNYRFEVPVGTLAHLRLPGEKETVLAPGEYTFRR
ncbi:MAG: alpha-L-rhamnosidase [Lentisphaerae bacterium]|nr:alpha-L-rhamnosidase [Lentisphaerota bacterium]